ncbi:MAG: MltA domain-containing protein [Pseudomonadota bacterium]|nr:MltA domain-containing protein [Pseudomonadota bacterium]
MMRVSSALAIFIVLLAGCVSRDKQHAPNSIKLSEAAYRDLPAWRNDQHADAILAFKLSCPKLISGKARSISDRIIAAGDWVPICRAASYVTATDHAVAKRFFERWFVPFLVSTRGVSSGLFTGYFEAELRGSRIRRGKFQVPLFGLPSDMVRVELGQFDNAFRDTRIVGRVAGGKLLPYYRRSAIQDGAIEETAPVVAWVDDEIDAFLLHVQGSGRIRLENGGVLRVGFSGHNGHSYVSIGRILIDAGELSPGQAGWREIRKWISRNPEKATGLLAQNPRYIFFREISGMGPIGAQGVPLTPRRSLAIDPKFIPFGVPLWLDTKWPGTGGRPLRRLMIAQDAGNAIKGPIRGDFFWGYGNDALAEAGRMKSWGKYFILLPRSTVTPIS